MTRKEFCPTCRKIQNFVNPKGNKKLLMCDTCHLTITLAFFKMNDTQLFLMENQHG